MRKPYVGLLVGALALIVAAVGAGTFLTSEGRGAKSGTPPNDRRLVENGAICDKALVEVPDGAILIVPDNARLERVGYGRRVEIYMVKWLGFGGWPPEPMSFHQCHRNMGCACKADAGRFVISTYGEWRRIEGGAGIRLFIRVPEGLAVESKAGLSGEDSAAGAWPRRYPTGPSNGYYWYGPTSPVPDWQAIPDEADPDCVAAMASKARS